MDVIKTIITTIKNDISQFAIAHQQQILNVEQDFQKYTKSKGVIEGIIKSLSIIDLVEKWLTQNPGADIPESFLSITPIENPPHPAMTHTLDVNTGLVTSTEAPAAPFVSSTEDVAANVTPEPYVAPAEELVAPVVVMDGSN